MPSAKLVTMCAILPPTLGEALLGRGRAVRILQPLDVAADERGEADGADEPVEVHLHAGLITVARREHHTGAVSVGLENRADGAVELRIHEHHVLAMRDRFEGDLRAVRHVAGHLDDGVEPVGATQQHRVLGDGRLPATDRIVERTDVIDRDRIGAARFAVGTPGVGKRAVAHRSKPYPGHRIDDLVGDSAPHEARAHHAHAHWVARGGARGERPVDDDHAGTAALAPRRGQFRSLSEIDVTGCGHGMANAGSS